MPPPSLRRQNTSVKPVLPKNVVLDGDHGRLPWYNQQGEPVGAYIIGLAGGSASGKTRVSQAILRELSVPWVLVISQDSFYRELTPEQSERAFRSEYDFDSPDAFDNDLLIDCLRDLKAGKAVRIPQYSFVKHQREPETTLLYGATVVIIEGLFVLYDERIRNLLDLRIFVQCDSDLMLARRLRRDLVERGRDAQGLLDQYLRFVKPSFDNIIQPTSRFADVIVPGQSNETSIQLIASHIRKELNERQRELRAELFRAITPAATPRDEATKTNDENRRTGRELPDTVHLLNATHQLTGLHTLLRDINVSREDFLFYADRVCRLVIEHALSLLPRRRKRITTPIDLPYDGVEFEFDRSKLCGVSVLRSGAALERGLRQVVRDIAIGRMLIQSDPESGEPLLHNVSLPEVLTYKHSAGDSFVLLLDSQCGTGAAALMAVRVLLDHGVPEDHIIFCCILVSKVGGVWALKRAFPAVRIVTSWADDELEERVVEGRRTWTILPGLGSFGDRYFGTEVRMDQTRQ